LPAWQRLHPLQLRLVQHVLDGQRKGRGIVRHYFSAVFFCFGWVTFGDLSEQAASRRVALNEVIGYGNMNRIFRSAFGHVVLGAFD
jgi:hypothetical protein